VTGGRPQALPRPPVRAALATRAAVGRHSSQGAGASQAPRAAWGRLWQRIAGRAARWGGSPAQRPRPTAPQAPAVYGGSVSQGIACQYVASFPLAHLILSISCSMPNAHFVTPRGGGGGTRPIPDGAGPLRRMRRTGGQTPAGAGEPDGGRNGHRNMCQTGWSRVCNEPQVPQYKSSLLR